MRKLTMIAATFTAAMAVFFVTTLPAGAVVPNTVVDVPEPATLSLLALGVAGLLTAGRRRS